MADKRSRRRSLRIFHSRSNTPDAAPALSLTSSPVEVRLSDHGDGSPSTGDGASPGVRPRVLGKPNRASVFGSLRSLHSLDEDEKGLAKSDSKSSSFHEDGDLQSRGIFGDHVKRAAEVQVAGTSIWKAAKRQYIVLTESHLIRFKSQAKASEMFPIIPHGGKSSLPRSMSSIGSYSDMQLNAVMDITQGVPLDEVVAVYKIEDGRPYFGIEVSYLDERGKRSSSLQISFSTAKDAEAWSVAIREVAAIRRAQYSHHYHQRTLEYLARALDKERDYDPLHFRLFKAVQRCPIRPAARAPAEDLSKSSSSVCYLVIGVNKIHLIPIPRISGRSSSTSLSEVDSPASFGIMCLTAIRLHQGENTFELYFRAPLRQPYIASLASYDAPQIALWLRYASEYLRPEWTVQSFVFSVPADLEDQMDAPSAPLEDNNSFDRTLMAFCAAYDVEASRIYYSVDYHCEDAPCFRLLPPASGHEYSITELVAVFRALRYNEAFASISFANVNLAPMRSVYDPFGDAEDSLCSRHGVILDIPGHVDLSVFQQELRALSIKSRKLRRFDFSYSFPTKPSDLSSGVPEALTPLCKKSVTNVDWITLTGVRLSENDVEFLVDAASERHCHLRALDIGQCGLSVHDIDVLLSTLGVQENTVEVIDISGSHGRFSPELFQRAVSAFGRLRRLNLTRVQKTAGPEPLISPEILLSWRLESLHLNGTSLNEQSVDTISAYLASTKSNLLRDLSVSQCGLSGRDLAIFFRSMTRDGTSPRKMHLSASENRLGNGSSQLCKCIAENQTPTSITMRMIDFDKEYQFRELIVSLTKNSTIKSLDISQASLPYDASMETCEAIKDMFSTNRTLEELDISGDVAHLDVARFGIGLNVALLGLEHNTTIKVLRVEHQNLGLQGANTLAGVIEKNHTLEEIHCEHNDMNLQAFTVLVNALHKNTTLLCLPIPAADRAKSMEKVKEEFGALGRSPEPASPKPGILKRPLQAVIPRHRRQSSAMSFQSDGSFSQHDVHEMLRTLEERWDVQLARLQQYLLRNYQLASGVSWEELDHDSDVKARPATADSLTRFLARVNFDRPATGGRGLEVQPTGSMVQVNEKSSHAVVKTPMFSLPED